MRSHTHTSVSPQALLAGMSLLVTLLLLALLIRFPGTVLDVVSTLLLGPLLLFCIFGPPILLWKGLSERSSLARVVLVLATTTLLGAGQILLGGDFQVYAYAIVDNGDAGISGGQELFEIPYKGLTYENVQEQYGEYERGAQAGELSLCRESTLGTPQLLNYYRWYEYLTHPRWSIPHCDVLR